MPTVKTVGVFFGLGLAAQAQGLPGFRLEGLCGKRVGKRSAEGHWISVALGPRASAPSLGRGEPHPPQDRHTTRVPLKPLEHRLVHEVVDQERIVNLGRPPKPGERLDCVP